MRSTALRTYRSALLTASFVAVLGAGLVTAAPAQAENDFANGFEDQLGRLFAVEAFRIGHFVLASALPAPPVAYGYSDGTSYDDEPVVYERRHRRERRAHRRVNRRAHPRYHAYDCDEPSRHRDYSDDDYEYYDD